MIIQSRFRQTNEYHTVPFHTLQSQSVPTINNLNSLNLKLKGSNS